MGGTTSGERIQLRGRPRAHRQPPVVIGDAEDLRLVRGDPGRGLKPQRVLPRAVRTRSSGRPGGSARRVGHGQGVGQGGGPGWIRGGKEEETRRGARQHWSVVTPAATERASQLSGAQCCVINLYHHVINTNSSSLLLPPPSFP